MSAEQRHVHRLTWVLARVLMLGVLAVLMIRRVHSLVVLMLDRYVVVALGRILLHAGRWGEVVSVGRRV